MQQSSGQNTSTNTYFLTHKGKETNKQLSALLPYIHSVLALVVNAIKELQNELAVGSLIFMSADNKLILQISLSVSYELLSLWFRFHKYIENINLV